MPEMFYEECSFGHYRMDTMLSVGLVIQYTNLLSGKDGSSTRYVSRQISCLIDVCMNLRGLIKEVRMLLDMERRYGYRTDYAVTTFSDFPPIPVDDLPTTYLSKHRDSDFMFTVEFEVCAF